MARVLAARGRPHPPVLGVVAQGRRMAIDADPEPENQNIARWMANGYTLVFRPQWSGGGEGVFFLSRDDEAWRINGHSATRAAGPQQGGGRNRFGQRHWQEADSPWLG